MRYMRLSALAFCTTLFGLPVFAQTEEPPLRDFLIRGPDGHEPSVVRLHQPGSGQDLGGAITLRCLLSDLLFEATGEINFAVTGTPVPGCPDDSVAGNRMLRREVVLIERIGVERSHIVDDEMESGWDVAIIDKAPSLSLATVCADQDFPR